MIPLQLTLASTSLASHRIQLFNLITMSVKYGREGERRRREGGGEEEGEEKVKYFIATCLFHYRYQW